MTAFFRRGSTGRVKSKSKTRELIESLVVALVLFLFLRTFVLQAFRIPSSSMEDTLLIGDFLFINKLEYGARIPFTDWRLPGFRDPQPGDIIVFAFPADDGQQRVDFIKRCVAVGGQTVEMRQKQLYVDGELQDEPYVHHGDPYVRRGRDEFEELTVPEGHLFMMGDNRDFSHDSRVWGPLPMRLVHGRAFVRYFSWDSERRRIRFTRMLTGVE
jgi:signal peptidase I